MRPSPSLWADDASLLTICWSCLTQEVKEHERKLNKIYLENKVSGNEKHVKADLKFSGSFFQICEESKLDAAPLGFITGDSTDPAVAVH